MPLLALALLGTVFLFTADDSYDPGFTFSDAEFDSLAQGSFLDNSKINGRTTQGDVFSIAADRIEPKTTDLSRIIAHNLTSRFDFVDGSFAEISAETAQIVNKEQLLHFPNGAHIVTSDGYDGAVQNLTANMKSGEISGEFIEAEGPLGHISAEKFHISNAINARGENQVLSFEKDVRVTLNTPAQTE